MGSKEDYRYSQVAGGEDETRAHGAQFVSAADDGEGAVNMVNMPTKMVSASGSGTRKFLYLAACTANIASFVCGTSFGWTSPEIPKLQGNTDNPLGSPLTETQEGWVGSFLPLAAAIGPFAAGIMSDKIGRKKTLLIGAIPFLIAFGINLVANSVYYFYLSRFLCGLGVGIIFTVLPMYIAEISDDDVRSSLGSFMQLFIVLGLLFSYVLGPYLTIFQFNIMLLIPPALFVISFLFFIPESPYYLIQVGANDAAEEALIKLRAKGKNAVQKEMETIKNEVDQAQQDKGNFFDIFKSRGLTYALILSVSLVSFQQFSGINIVLFYTQGIFTDAGVSLAPELCTILIGVVQVFASSLTPVLVERQGKRFLLILSGIGMSISQGALAYFFYLKDDQKSDVSAIGWVPIVSLIVFISTYCLGFGPLPWAVMGELFPGNVKSIAATVTASGCWILGFLLTNYFGAVTGIIGKSGSFGAFAICCMISAAFVYKLLPETRGKSLQEIQYILNGNSRST